MKIGFAGYRPEGHLQMSYYLLTDSFDWLYMVTLAAVERNPDEGLQ